MGDFVVSHSAKYLSLRGSSTYFPAYTMPGTAHTKGSWVELASAAAVTGPIRGFWLSINGTDSNSGAMTLWDIGVGAAGSETVVLPNLLVQMGNEQRTALWHSWMPLNLPASTRIAIRGQSSLINVPYQVALMACLQGPAGLPTWDRASTVGANTSDSGGTQVDPGATPDTKGNWVELSSSTPHPAKALLLSQGPQDNTTLQTSMLFRLDLGLGAASSEVVMLPDWPFRQSGVNDMNHPYSAWFLCDIPAGQRLAVRAQSNDSNVVDRLFDVAVTLFG